MGMLENIKTGRENKPPRIMVYGQEGVGKSTFGASAPDPVFIQTEDGLGEIDTAKFPLAKNLNDVLPMNPTAENIARWICDRTPNAYKVEVWESEMNMAAYERD